MSPSPSLFARRQVLLFFLCSYLLSWWSLPPLRGLLPHGVTLAAVIVLALAEGVPGLSLFWSRLKRVRAGWWYLAAPTIILGFQLADAASRLLADATLVGLPHVNVPALAAELLLLGGLWEEPGWTGYALPALQKRFAHARYGILIATVLLGVARGVWHLPLVLVGAIPWYDAVWFTPFVFQPFITWLYNKSGSVAVVIVFHYLSNLLFSLNPVFTGGDRLTYTVVYLTSGALAALVLAWWTRFEFGWRDVEA